MLPVPNDQLATVLRLARLLQNLDHPIARLVDADHELRLRRLVDVETLRARVAELGVDPAGAERHGVEPGLFHVDFQRVPRRGALGGAVGGIGEGEGGAVGEVILCYRQCSNFLGGLGEFCLEGWW